MDPLFCGFPSHLGHAAHRAELLVQYSRFSCFCLLLFEKQVLRNPLECLCRSTLPRGPSCSEWWGARYSLGDPHRPTTLPLSCGSIFSEETPRPLNYHIFSDTALGHSLWGGISEKSPGGPDAADLGTTSLKNAFLGQKLSTSCVCAQSCPALWDPTDCSSPGSCLYGIS